MLTSTAPLPDRPLPASAPSPLSDAGSHAPGHGRRLTLGMVLVVLAAGWGVYSRVTGYDFIPLDDPGYVYEHQAVQQGLSLAGVRWAFTSLELANWHPLTWLSLMADYQVYGLNAGGYHLSNVLLHLAASVGVFLWLVQATGRRWPSVGVGLLFCLSPAHVESVAWVTERKDVLSSVCLLGVLMAYTRYGRTGSRVAYGGALGALVLGLLAKPMLVTVPGVLLLLDGWPLGRLRSRKDLPGLLGEKVPFALLAAASCVITFLAQHRGGATTSLENLPLFLRFASALTAYAAYLGKLFWPVNLAVFYPWDGQSIWPTAACALGLAAATFAAVRLRRSHPYVLVGWLWYLGTLVPVIGLVQVGSQAMADRYMYVPSIGLFLVLCWSAADLWRSRPRLRPLLAAASVAALTLCAALCYRQVGYWQNGATLFEHALAITRPTARVYGLLGLSRSRLHRYAEAETAYRQEFGLDGNAAELNTKLGYLHLEQGHWDDAARLLQLVSTNEICKNDPVLFNSLGYALNKRGRFDEASTALRRSLELRPVYAFAHNNLADALLASGRSADAVAEYEAALALKPDIPPALAQLAWLYSFADAEHSPQRAARSLVLARRAVDLTGGGDVASLDALAAAEAAVNAWPQAAAAARAALERAASQPGRPADYLAKHRERVEAYSAGVWPER